MVWWSVSQDPYSSFPTSQYFQLNGVLRPTGNKFSPSFGVIGVAARNAAQ